MKKNQPEKLAPSRKRELLLFSAKTLLYFGIMLALVYLYHFSHIRSGGFIYNQF